MSTMTTRERYVPSAPTRWLASRPREALPGYPSERLTKRRKSHIPSPSFGKELQRCGLITPWVSGTPGKYPDEPHQQLEGDRVEDDRHERPHLQGMTVELLIVEDGMKRRHQRRADLVDEGREGRRAIGAKGLEGHPDKDNAFGDHEQQAQQLQHAIGHLVQHPLLILSDGSCRCDYPQRHAKWEEAMEDKVLDNHPGRAPSERRGSAQPLGAEEGPMPHLSRP